MSALSSRDLNIGASFYLHIMLTQCRDSSGHKLETRLPVLLRQGLLGELALERRVDLGLRLIAAARARCAVGNRPAGGL